MTDEEILKTILKRAKSPMWWARLSYINNEKFWNEDERRVLRSVFGDRAR